MVVDRDVAPVVAQPGIEPDLAVETQRAGSTTLLVIRGELDAASRAILVAAADDALAEDACRELVVSCEGLGFIDSSGLRGLLAVRAACAGTDTRLHLVNRGPFLEQLLRVTGLNPAFP